MKDTKKIVLASMIMVMFALASVPAAALDTYWQHDPLTPGSWHDLANWDNGVPTIDDRAYIDNGGTAQIFADAESYVLYAGYDNSGTIEQLGGTNTVDGYLYLGYDYGSSGIYNLIDGELFTGYREYIAFCGTGEFNQTGGTNTVGGLYLGSESGGSGTYNISAGNLSAQNEYVGYEGTGVFNQTGGIHTVNSSLILGYRYGSSGTYNLSGTGELSAGSEYIGGYYGPGTGVFNQTGGTNTVDDYLYLGNTFGSSGTYNLGGTGELSAGSEYIGGYGTGVFNQTGGTHAVDGYLHIGPEASGEYKFSGGSFVIGDLDINNGWMDIDLNKIDFFRIGGDKVALLDGYILDGKIFDSSMGENGSFFAVYDSENDWTTLQSIPEPTTIVLFGAALAGMAGIIRRRFK